MKRFTNESSLKIKEFSILSLLKDDYLAKFALSNLMDFLSFKDIVDNSSYLTIFNIIYIERIKITNWKLAELCNISESTLFRIRHDLIDYFYKRYDYERQRYSKLNG